MKKFLYSVLIPAILIGIFLGGAWYGRREPVKHNSPAEKSKVINPAGDAGDDASSLPPGTVKITPEKQQIIGVRTGQVERGSTNHILRTTGRVAADETRIYRLNAVVDGWITKALPNSTGSFVKKHEVLASFYSPEFLSAEQALIYALSSMDRVQTAEKEIPGQKERLAQFNINLRQYRDTLRNLGMGDRQVEELIRTRTYMENIDITSPVDGFILVRNLSPGQRFEKGTEWYRIADLSKVWVLADLFQNEAEYVKPGKKVRVIVPQQKKEFHAMVSSVLPQFDAASRTLKVRLEADNPGYALRPDMFVDVELPIQLPPAITVPADSILDSGLKKTVFVYRGDGYFEPREVETGWRIGNRVEITKGLEVGEKIVTSGTFLIDSESKLELAAQGMYTTLSKDPVCGIDVAMRKAEKAGLKASHGGKTYYFHSEECKKKFEKEPERYAEKPAQGDSPSQPTPPSKSLETKGHGHG